MNCQAVEAGNVIERYVLGTMSEAEQNEFEQHYFVCAACFGELQAFQAIRGELERRMIPARRGSRAAWLPIAAALAIAFGLAASIYVWRPGGVPPVKVAQVAPPAAPNPEPPSLALLARVDPPPYSQPNLRGATTEAASRFRAAMQLYSRQDYRAAAEALTVAARLDPSAAGPRFYLGICRLLLGQPDAAAGELRRVISLGASRYVEPAHFYLAKALLAQEDTAGAAAELNETIRLSGDREKDARELLERLAARNRSRKTP
jgi:tetratricopeptide (TPR) repeat protein